MVNSTEATKRSGVLPNPEIVRHAMVVHRENLGTGTLSQTSNWVKMFALALTEHTPHDEFYEAVLGA